MTDASVAVADTLIRDAYVVTLDAGRRVFTRGFLAFAGGRITAVGSMAESLPPAREVIDARGMIVMPGMANGHNHLIQNAFRGYNDDRWPVLDIPAAVRSLLEQLFAASGRMDAGRTYAIVRLHALEMLKAGYTATHDEHFTNARKDSVDGSWQALADSGMRGFLCRCIVDDRVPEDGRESVDEGLSELDRLRAFGSDRITVAGSFVNYSFRSDPEDMRRIHEGTMALGLPFGVDMTDNSRGAMLKARGFEGGQADYYRAFGLLDHGPIYAGKGVNLLRHEYALLAEHDARLALVPTLRFFDGQGVPVHDFLEAGMLPGLGTDAPLVSDSQDPFENMRHAIFGQNLAVKARVAAGGERPDAALWLNAERCIEMATLGGVRSLLLEDTCGALEVGKAADLVMIDAARAEIAPTWDERRLLGSLVWGGKGAQVHSVFVAGERLIDAGRSTRWDEDEVIREADAALTAIAREADLGRFLPTRQAGAAYRGWAYH
ncbi:amidohydrolase family protein [Novosphingobium kaempferiae]|uniref:amidohydrolase family protein n=1 Tax=Novosphingobium kaempferiae TaxID=2896849 RepID=UPI001E65A47B|nr:amidohydrolase family protein [Novosphingobium kaempferiae]